MAVLVRGQVGPVASGAIAASVMTVSTKRRWHAGGIRGGRDWRRRRLETKGGGWRLEDEDEEEKEEDCLPKEMTCR